MLIQLPTNRRSTGISASVESILVDGVRSAILDLNASEAVAPRVLMPRGVTTGAFA